MDTQLRFQNTTTQINTNLIVTMNILEASKLLGTHKETTRRLAASGEIPGVKIGRGWRFIEQDLVNYIRAQYITPFHLSAPQNRSKQLCPSQKETTSGGLTSLTMEKEYARALELR